MSDTASQAAKAAAEQRVADYERVLEQSDQKLAAFEARQRGILERLQHLLHGAPVLVPMFVLLLSLVIFGLLIGHIFFDPLNFMLILQQVTVVAVVGIAQTLVILTAGIDLSVSAILVLCSVVMGRLSVHYGWPWEVGVLLGLAVGTACGAVNGFLVTKVRLPPFIVTLGTLNIFFALNLWFSNSETIQNQDLIAKASPLLFFGNSFKVFGGDLTYGSIFMVLLFFGVWYMLNRTAWGRHVHAVGDDVDAARLAGIQTDRTLLTVYALAGLICALGAFVMIGRVGSISPNNGQTSNLDSITAVVIGGTSLFGGRGSIFGTLFGALIIGVFVNGLALYGVDVLWQEFAIGVLSITAVALDQWLRRVSQ